MAFKRKRDLDESPMSICSYSASTPDAPSPSPMPHDMDMEMDLDSTPQTAFGRPWESFGARLSAADLGSRTRKRVRDNRPDERAIHQNTINKLFAAQRQHPHAEPIMSESLSTPPQPAPAVQKSTLHSFWKQLPAPPVQPPIAQSPQQQPAPQSWDSRRCEDCEAPLDTDRSSMDVDMDVAGNESTNPFACQDCGRSVCGTCAVVSNTRHCLQCATGRDSGRWW